MKSARNQNSELSAEELAEIQKEQNRERRRAFRRQQFDSPLRYLALPPAHLIRDISFSDFAFVRRTVVESRDFARIPRFAHAASPAETIYRACHLLFALVESGGLCVGAPEQHLLRLKINVGEARFGLVRAISIRGENKEAKKNLSAGLAEGNAEDDNPKTSLGKDATDARPKVSAMPPTLFGLRQPLYALGRFHLNAFINYRIVKQKAANGDSLLPKFEFKRAELRAAAKVVPWLKTLSTVPQPGWRSVFKIWLNHHVSLARGIESKAAWKNAAVLAAWQIYEREQHPFLIAARRRLFQSTPLTDAAFKSFFEFEPASFAKTVNPRFGKTPNENTVPGDTAANQAAANTDSIVVVTDQAESDVRATAADDESAIVAGGARRSDELAAADQDYNFVARVLSLLAGSREQKSRLIESLLGQAESSELKCGADHDLRLLLKFAARSSSEHRISTAYTHAARILRALYSLPEKSFARWQTADVAEYLENYETAASVKNVRGSLRLFDDFLASENIVQAEHIRWNSRALQPPASFRARNVLSEQEYLRVRRQTLNGSPGNRDRQLEELCLLTLLRRCGLRAGEAEQLTTKNFSGHLEWKLFVARSKTRAGRRSLPLYLLLDAAELDELREFVERRESQSSKAGTFLFVDEQNEKTTAARIGRRVESLLRAGGVAGETAHGLRHAFASSLFGSFWLKIAGDATAQTGNTSNWARRALEQFARPAVEGRAVNHPFHLQLLLGHADLRVTFERYVHLLELISADAVWQYEQSDAAQSDRTNFKTAAAVLGMDDKLLRRAASNDLDAANSLPLPTIAALSASRLTNFI